MRKKEKLTFLTKKELFYSWKVKKKAVPYYREACNFFGTTLIDRTETIDSGLDFEVLEPINNLKTTTKTFAQICKERAEEIILNNHSETITILWSGGIDSTVAFIAIYKALNIGNNLQRLNLILSQESIDEFPNFFNDFIKDKITFTFMKTTTIYEEINSKHINVTGENGDQLFGSDKVKYYVLAGEAFQPYQDILPFVISRKLGTEKYTQGIIDLLEPQIKKSPIPIITFYDYLWWMNFSLKWQHVSLRLISSLEENKFELESNFYNFFQSKDFQSWAISNPTFKIKEKWNSYKFTAKQYIFDFYPDEDYFLNKEKEQSLKNVIVKPPTLLTYLMFILRKINFYY